MKLQLNSNYLKLHETSLTKSSKKSSNSLKCNKFRKNLERIAWMSLSTLILLMTCFALLTAQNSVCHSAPRERADRVVSCYYNTPSSGDQRQLRPDSIHPHLCTHINVAFAQVKEKKIYMVHHQYQTLSQVVSLKKVNPKLKILLSIGGASNDSGFPEMVADHASRKVFIGSVKSILRNYSLDGIDLDWEFPAVGIQNYEPELMKRQRQHFSQLLREIRMEYIRERRSYLLTVAVAAPQIIVDAAYDVDQINLYVDYANIMTYDFHYFTQFTPFTGLNSPLYARSAEQLYMATLNINYTVHMYIDKGLHRNKIVVGVPTYGHSFQLVNADNGKVGSPALAYGDLGQLGFVNYPAVCQFVHNFKNEVKITFDSEARVPYLQSGHVWVSFDDPKSVMEKARYIAAYDLRGAMIYSLNADDYDGVCGSLSGSTKFPLAASVKEALNGNDTHV